MSKKLIMIDGPDGVGKTTQIQLLRDSLELSGQKVFLTRINGGSEIGEQLRHVVLSEIERQPMTDHYVFMAMHTELRYDLQAHFDANEVVLMDRSPLSDWAYQKFGGELHSAEFERNIDLSMDLFSPTLVICYEAPLEVLRDRMSRQTAKADYFGSKPNEFFEKVIAGYTFAAQRYGATLIDAAHSPEEVHEATMRAINTVID